MKKEDISTLVEYRLSRGKAREILDKAIQFVAAVNKYLGKS